MASDTRMATDSVTANSRNSRPTIPPINRMGINTATSEMLIESTVKPISDAPLSDASHRAHALFQIARHVLDHYDRVVHHEARGHRQRHQREIVDAVAEQIHRAKVPISETGTATPGISVARTFRRKTKTTKITSTTEIMSVRSTSFTEARMVDVRSSTTVKSIPAGTEASKPG